MNRRIGKIGSGEQGVKAVLRRYSLRGRRISVAPLAILAIIGFVGVFAPLLAPHHPNDQNLAARLEPPSLGHPLGTDHLGRDVLSRLLVGSRFSLAITTVSALIAGVFGTLIGAYSGRAGGVTDEAIMRVVDGVLVFPELVVAFVLASLLDQNFATIVLAVTIFAWTPYARLARAVTLEVNTREFMEAAEALGSTPAFILRRHILPNILSPVLAMGFLRFGQILITIAGLSYLGVGAQPPTPDWGRDALGGATLYAPYAVPHAVPRRGHIHHRSERYSARTAHDAQRADADKRLSVCREDRLKTRRASPEPRA